MQSRLTSPRSAARRTSAITFKTPDHLLTTELAQTLAYIWSCPGSTAAILCSTALPATASRSCSEYRTTQLRSFSRLQDDPTPVRCWGRYTGCPFSRGSTTKWLCWRSKSAAHRRRCPYCTSPNPGLTTQPHPAIGHYDTVSTFHDNDFCESRLSMLCSGCLELTTENCR